LIWIFIFKLKYFPSLKSHGDTVADCRLFATDLWFKCSTLDDKIVINFNWNALLVVRHCRVMLRALRAYSKD